MTRKIFSVFCFAVALFVSCGKETGTDEKEGSAILLCMTSEAFGVTQTTAILNGTATIKNAKASNANAYFYYSTTQADAKTLKASGQRLSAGTIPNTGGDFSANLGSLLPATTYYYVASVSIDDQEELGGVKSFTTEKKTDSFSVTGAAIDITVNSATLTAYANLPADMTGDVTIGIIYSTSSSPSLQNGKLLTSKDLDGNNMYQVEATDLTPDTKYYFKSFLSRSNLNYYGEVKEFTTAQVLASVFTLDAWDVAETKAMVGGKVVISSKGVLSKSAVIYYGADGTSADALKTKGKKVTIEAIDEDGTFKAELTSLTSSTKYYFIAVVTVEGVEFAGEIKNFTTQDKPTAISITGESADVGETSAKLYGWCNQEGAEGASVVFGIEYSATDLTAAATTITASEKDAENKYCCLATGLSANTLYYYRAFTLFNGVRSYGEVKTFTTLDYTVTVTTLAATDVTEFKATLNGSLYVESNDNLSKSVSFLYSDMAATLEELKITGNVVYGSLAEDGSFQCLIPQQSSYYDSGKLNYNTTYYYVACSNVQGKEVYGEVKSFKTMDITATVATLAASDITEFKATLNGALSVVSEEELSKTVWFLYSDTATTLDALKSSGKSAYATLAEDGTFQCLIPQQSSYYDSGKLNYNTTYYYVACSNVQGKEVYGEVKSFKTMDITATITCYSENVDKITATISGTLTVTSKETLSQSVTLYYGTKNSSVEDLMSNGQRMSISLNQDGNFSTNLSSLINGTTYYYVAVATVHDKVFNSTVKSFTTLTPNCPSGAVNLGLSVCWATCNVGASSPEQKGNLYAWGETEPKTSFGWANYKWANGTFKTLTKYNWDSKYGVVDNLMTLELCDDAAHVALGFSWRTPTKEEYEELFSKCKYEFYVMNGVAGVLVTGKLEGYTSNSIFIPDTNNNGTSRCEGRYWTSSLKDTGHHGTPDFAELFSFHGSGKYNAFDEWQSSMDYSLGSYGATDSDTGRSSGHCVRGVID